VKLLFVSLNKISAVCCCPQQKPTRAKKSSEAIAADVRCNIERTAGSKKLKAKSINDLDNVTVDYKRDK